MVTVKISFPELWLKHGHWPYQNHFPSCKSIWGNYRFEINNDADKCDFWVVHESVDKREKVKCQPGNVILITSEEKQQVPSYNIKYLKQFGAVITTRDDIDHSNCIRTAYMCPWRVRKTYDEISQFNPKKTNGFSAIISNNISTPGHRKRYEFVKRLKIHFKDRMTWYGKGGMEVEDKWDALESYKYSLALENCSAPFYFTEKIMDCFCASTVPVYWGCPNIKEYFPDKSFILVDIENEKKSILEIERAMEDNFYEKNYQTVLESKQLVLNRFQFIPALVNILETFRSIQTPSVVSSIIEPEHQFSRQSPFMRVLQTIRRKI